MKIRIKVPNLLGGSKNPNPFKSLWDNKNDYDDAINLLIYLNKFCKKHKIDYILSDGTLLGQQRHKGFIPWDDDMDVAAEEEAFLEHKDKLENDDIGISTRNHENIYFKIYYKKNVKIKEYEWSWPFLDIFLYKRDKDNNKIHLLSNDGTHIFEEEDIYPIKEDKFENLKLPIPNNPSIILKKLYGEDYMTTCKSGNWNHRLEWLKKDVTKPCSEVIDSLE
jgi:phosphorylcholine metabolism protein LicD